MNKEKRKKSRIIMKMKVYFLIINLVFSIIAISFLIGLVDAQTGTGGCTGGTCGVPPSTTSTSGTSTGSSTSSIAGNDKIEEAIWSLIDGTLTSEQERILIENGIIEGTGSSTDITPGGDIGISDQPGGGQPPGGGEGGTGGVPPGGVPPGGGGGPFGGISLQSIIMKAGIGAGIFGTIGALAGGDQGALWGSVAGSIGGVVAGLTEQMLGELGSTLLGIGVATIIFLLTYKKVSQETVEFYCLPWQAPIGGEDCQLCNNFKECSEYTCKSLGQACEIINPGSVEQKCVWKNPHDVNSPIIEFKEVNKGHKFKPNPSVRPPATGIIVLRSDANCLKAFTPLEFTFTTSEPAQCKIDYNLTKGFDEMGYYVGGDSLLLYNHTEKLSLPGPDAINAIAPELKNNGEYNLFIRCKDANGNFNQDAYSVSFCVEKGPDTTPPRIEGVNIPSERPVQFNQTRLYLEVYVNEPSECKWSREDRAYSNMENKMLCDTNLWEMNGNNVYTCRTNLTGIENRKENNYYFRCKDQPWEEEGDRNENKQSYLYKIIGTQPLNILESKPLGAISGATDTVPVFLEIKTDNGYKNGEALCYFHQFKPAKDEDYILFSETNANQHKQRQDLVAGNYTYYFKCVDLGGNSAYNRTNFKVEIDRTEPLVVRVYKESGELKIITNEQAECSYSTKDCNFEIQSGIKITTFDNVAHTAEWKINQNYYARCKDLYNNQPNPNTCSITVRPSKIDTKSEVIEIE